MTDHDVLYGYRLALFDLAGRTSVSDAYDRPLVSTLGVRRWQASAVPVDVRDLSHRDVRRSLSPSQFIGVRRVGTP
jgi:hypothetical protein